MQAAELGSGRRMGRQAFIVQAADNTLEVAFPAADGAPWARRAILPMSGCVACRSTSLP
jgi:hypothetical protein